MRKNRRDERRVVIWVNHREEAASKGFRLVLSLISLQGMQVKATETISVHSEREMEKEADRFARKEVWTKAKIRSVHPFDNSIRSSLKEMGCREEETEWNEKTKKEKTQPGKGPGDLNRKQLRKGDRWTGHEVKKKTMESGWVHMIQRSF